MTAAEADLWLFGYGSLIWKADFEYQVRRPARLSGWQRRFWQGSHDHRGTPDNPGRVVTLVREPEATCVGMAYLISATKVAAVLEHLDFREKNGYQRFDAPINFIGTESARQQTSSEASEVKALVYVATPDNFAHLGPATDEAIAEQIAKSVGPSGSNREYLLELHRALGDLGTSDAHINRLVDLVQNLG